MDPIMIAAYIELAGKLSGIIGGMVQQMRKAGVSDETIAAITADYDRRITDRQAGL